MAGIVGDFNVNFGRGLALSIRKIDEIGVDATIKGARVDVRTKPVRASAIAGYSNRQNSDFATRQLLPDPGYPKRLLGTPKRIDPNSVGNPFWTVCSDLVAGGRVEGTLPGRVLTWVRTTYSSISVISLPRASMNCCTW